MSSTSQLVTWLSDPKNHSDQPERVELVQTHISWIFLTRQFAYKLKKPVQFDFLDFRSVEDRRQACVDEVRLNRRLATDVYLGVVPIQQSPEGNFAMNGSGDVVDWLVKMQRLDDARRCDGLLKRDAIKSEMLTELAHKLARFYQHAPAEAISPSTYMSRLIGHVRSNRKDLLQSFNESIHSTVKRVSADQLVYLHAFADQLRDRVCEGRIVEGHGDLRPEHIYFYSPPKIVDCVEFNREYRVVDVCDDLAFFAMECGGLGHPGTARQVLDECFTELGDAPRKELIDFFTSYRACVRAKVSLSKQAPSTINKAGSTEQALHYLHLAEAHAPLGGPPWLLIVCGGVGTGKSTLAALLAEQLGFELLQSDKVRRDVFGTAGRGAGKDEGIYSQANRLQVYRQLLQEAARALDEQVPVVLDASFQMHEAWEELERLLPHTRARVLVIQCRTSPELARQRIEQRLSESTDPSDARPEMVDSKAAPVPVPENLAIAAVNTANPPAMLADYVYRRMRDDARRHHG